MIQSTKGDVPFRVDNDEFEDSSSVRCLRFTPRGAVDEAIVFELFLLLLLLLLLVMQAAKVLCIDVAEVVAEAI